MPQWISINIHIQASRHISNNVSISLPELHRTPADATGDQRRVIIELWESDYLKDDYVGRWEVALEEVVGRGGHYVGTVVIEGMCPSSLIVPDCRKPKVTRSGWRYERGWDKI